MRKFVIGLSALLLIAPAKPGAAQDATTIEASQRPECAEYYGCVEDRPLSEAEARSSRGYPRPVAAQAARPLPEKRASEATSLEQPSLMDTSWRHWPSRTDF
jgi:hypothetical protein